MLRHIPQPLHAGGLEADAGVEAAGDGAVDDGLLLLLQQLDQLLLGADVPPDPPVRVVQEADDGGLFGERWSRQPDRFDRGMREAIASDTVCLDVKLVLRSRALKGTKQ